MLTAGRFIVQAMDLPVNPSYRGLLMKIKFFAYIRDYTRTKETTLENCDTVEELLQKLCTIYGKRFEEKVFKNGELSAEIIILVNGRHITHYQEIATRLKPEDEISIFPVVAGG